MRGIVKSATTGEPVAGALVGLLPLGGADVSESTLLTWGSTNKEGAFKLNKPPVPLANTAAQDKASREPAYSSDVEIFQGVRVDHTNACLIQITRKHILSLIETFFVVTMNAHLERG